jgi:hypothetical protein
MDVDQAVKIAKNWINEIYLEEGITNLGLEEVTTDGKNWSITVAFSRPWNTVKSACGLSPWLRSAYR